MPEALFKIKMPESMKEEQTKYVQRKEIFFGRVMGEGFNRGASTESEPWKWVQILLNLRGRALPMQGLSAKIPRA